MESRRSAAPRQPEHRVDCGCQSETRNASVTELSCMNSMKRKGYERKRRWTHLFCKWCRRGPAQRWSETGWSEACLSSVLCSPSLLSSHPSLSCPSSALHASFPSAWARDGHRARDHLTGHPDKAVLIMRHRRPLTHLCSSSPRGRLAQRSSLERRKNQVK